MSRITLLALLLVVGTSASSGPAEEVLSPAADLATASRGPVVVELFTSEGCSSCPPADAILSKLARVEALPGVEVIALGEHVDYWNYLGWTDRFSSSAFSARQTRYQERVFPRGVVYTPQVVVDGVAEALGSDAAAVRRAIAKAAQRPKLALRVRAARATGHLTVTVDVDEVIEHRAALTLIAVEDGLTTDVRRGENRGRTLSHDAVVRSITTVAEVDVHETAHGIEHAVPIGADWDLARMRVVALLQDTASLAVVGAAEVPVAAL
jgi:hypothetical protein